MGFDYYAWMKRHVGHHITCVYYGDSTNDPDDVCVECETCNEVLFSAEALCLKDSCHDLFLTLYCLYRICQRLAFRLLAKICFEYQQVKK